MVIAGYWGGDTGGNQICIHAQRCRLTCRSAHSYTQGLAHSYTERLAHPYKETERTGPLAHRRVGSLCPLWRRRVSPVVQGASSPFDIRSDEAGNTTRFVSADKFCICSVRYLTSSVSDKFESLVADK